MTEWKDIPGYEGAYQASSCGMVRSLDRVVRQRLGRTDCICLTYERRLKGTILRPVIGSHGYEGVLLRSNGRSRSFTVHELVMLAFVGPRPPGLEVRHLDGDKRNNKKSNLCYGTRLENRADMDAHGTQHRGHKSPLAKLTREQAEEIRRLSGRTPRCVLAEKFGVSLTTIRFVQVGATYTEAPRKSNPWWLSR